MSFDCTEEMYKRKTRLNARSATPVPGETLHGFANGRRPTNLPPRVLKHRGDHTFEVIRSAHLRHDRGTADVIEKGGDHGRLDPKRHEQTSKLITRATSGVEKRPNGRIKHAFDIHKSQQARALAQVQQINEGLDSVRAEVIPDSRPAPSLGVREPPVLQSETTEGGSWHEVAFRRYCCT